MLVASKPSGANFNVNLSAIAYCEAGTWIAHCLELDIVTEGKDADDAIQSVISLCRLQITAAIEAGDVESIFRPAPSEIWALFAEGRRKLLEEDTSVQAGSSVKRFEARELAFA